MSEIIKGMPMPEEAFCSGTMPYPWLQMEVGDAFKFRTSDFHNARVMCRNHSRNGKAFEARRVSKNEIYAWRVK